MLSSTVIGVELHRRVELHEVIHHRLQLSPSRPSWSPTRRSRVRLQLGRDGLDWSCTRWTSVDSTQGHRVQVQVQRGAAELNLDLDEVALSWSCTRRRTSTSRPSWSSTRRSRVELQLGRDVLVLLRVQLQCNVDELGGKYTEAKPRCTCPPYESTLQSSQRWSTECNFSAMLTSWEASTPRRSRGVLVLPTSQHCRGVCGGSPSATPMQIWREGRQVHRGEAEVYLPFLRVKFAPSRWSTTPITVELNVSTLSAPPLQGVQCTLYTDQYHSCKRSRVQWSLNRMEFWTYASPLSSSAGFTNYQSGASPTSTPASPHISSTNGNFNFLRPHLRF